MSTQPLSKFHFLTEAQYQQLTPEATDIYAVLMPSITPGEIIVKGFQGSLPTTLTPQQQAAARAFFGTGVKITSSDQTLTEAEIVNGDLLNCHIQQITVGSDTYKVLCVD